MVISIRMFADRNVGFYGTNEHLKAVIVDLQHVEKFFFAVGDKEKKTMHQLTERYHRGKTS